MAGHDLPNCGHDLGRAAFHSAPHAYLLLDPDFTIVDVNQRYLDLTRTRRKDLVGVGLFDAFPDNPNDPDADGVRNLRLSLETARETRQPHAMAVQKYDIPVRGDNAESFEERYWKPLNTPVIRDGEVVAMIHHVEDITTDTVLRRDQAIRLRSAQRLRELAFWEYDPSTGTAFVSRPFAAMQGLPERDGTMPAEACFATVDPEDREAVDRAFEEVAEEPDHTSIAFAHRVVRSDGSTRWLSSQGELVRDHRHALPRFLLVSMDITETKHRENELAQAVEERDRLLAQKEALLAEVNHRIKNSLQLVSSILNTDAHRAVEDDVRERLERAAARVRAVTSVHEMLYRSNEVATLAFGRYLRELCETLAAGDAAAAQATILCDPVEVRLPADQAIPLALMVNELVANAIKHGLSETKGGVIEVKTYLEGTDMLLEVSDNGMGKSEMSEHGLGTRIIDGLVGQLGATMTTGDQAPGYSVTIRLPYEAG